jgi:hypothetical protein
LRNQKLKETYPDDTDSEVPEAESEVPEAESEVPEADREANERGESSIKCILCSVNPMEVDSGCCHKCEDSKNKTCRVCKKAGHAHSRFNFEAYECHSCWDKSEASRQEVIRVALEKEKLQVVAIQAALSLTLPTEQIIPMESEDIKKTLTSIPLDGIILLELP